MPRITHVRAACVGMPGFHPSAIERNRRYPDGMLGLRTYVPAIISLAALRRVARKDAA